MRTVSQLSRLTGIDRRTIQYYANERVPGKSREGAGMIAPCYVAENGYRYFDEDALWTLLLIKTLKQCGYEAKEIRRIIDSEEVDIVSSIDEQIKALEESKQRIAEQIQFAGLLKMLIAVDPESEDEMFAAYSVPYAKIMYMTLYRVTSELAQEYGFDLGDLTAEDFFRGAFEASEGADIGYFYEMVKHAEKGELGLAVDAIPLDKRPSLLKREEPPNNEFLNAMLVFEKQFKMGVKPGGRESQRHISRILVNLLKIMSLDEIAVVGLIVQKILNEPNVAVVLELVHGEGFVEFITKSLESYFELAKKRLEKSLMTTDAMDTEEISLDASHGKPSDTAV